LALADAALAIAREKREAQLRAETAAARGRIALGMAQVAEERSLRAAGMEPVPSTRQVRQAFGPEAVVWVGAGGKMHVQREGVRRTAFGIQLHKVP
jgi:hypothetical protein